MTHIAPEQLIGHPFDRLYEPESVEFYSASRDHMSFEAQLLTGDGGKLPTLFKRSTLRDAAGETTGFLVFLTDMTELKATQAELHRAEGRAVSESDDRLASLADIAPTLLKFAGVSGPGLKGRSLLSEGPLHDRLFFESFVPADNFGWSPPFGLLKDGFKYIHLPHAWKTEQLGLKCCWEEWIRVDYKYIQALAQEAFCDGSRGEIIVTSNGYDCPTSYPGTLERPARQLRRTSAPCIRYWIVNLNRGHSFRCVRLDIIIRHR